MTYLIVHSTARDVALMRADFGNVVLQQLACCEEEFPHCVFWAHSAVAFNRRFEAEHDSSGVFLCRSGYVLLFGAIVEFLGHVEDDYIHTMVAVGARGEQSALAAEVGCACS